MQLRYMHEHHARPDVCVLDRNKQQHTVNTHYEDTAVGLAVCVSLAFVSAPRASGAGGRQANGHSFSGIA